MNPGSWTLIHAVEYGIFTTIFILLFYAYTSWLLKYNYRNSWENWFVAGKNKKQKIKWIIYIIPIIIVSSYVASGPFDLFGALIVSCGVSTAIVLNVYREEGKVSHKLSARNLLALWFALAAPFIFILWSSGYFFQYFIIGGNL